MNRAVPKERFNCTTFVYLLRQKIIYSLSPSNRACEQALRGALAAGREKEGELATTSLKFEYLHRKSRCKKLIGGDDISNDVITSAAFLARVFQCLFTFAHIRAGFRFALIGGNLTAQSTGSHREIGGGIQIPET